MEFLEEIQRNLTGKRTEFVMVKLSPRVSHSLVVRASNRYLEGIGFDTPLGRFFVYLASVRPVIY